MKKIREKVIILLCIMCFSLLGIFELMHVVNQNKNIAVTAEPEEKEEEKEKDFIKWVDFDVSYEALCKAYRYDVDTYQQDIHLNWIELLAYAATVGGGTFNSASLKTIDQLTSRLSSGETTMEEITKDMKYYPYYLECYSTVLGEFVGKYRNPSDGKEQYGLRCYLPIASTFPFSDYDDFGSSRSYGYARRHLGHDMIGQVGTPIIAIESGTVEAIGWNQYGGWRIGIRSFDNKRYYYYAHMRQNRPYAEGLEEGDTVTAGDVIGYMGHTGYSTKENVNNIKVTHLHWGLQLIFDESQKDGNGEIWIDCYALTRFLYKNRSEVTRNDETKEWTRTKFVEWID